MTDHTPPLGPLPEDTLRQQAFVILSRLQSGTEDVVRLDTALAAVASVRAYALQERAAVMTALQEADTIMGHDDEMTEWRDKWAHLWGKA